MKSLFVVGTALVMMTATATAIASPAPSRLLSLEAHHEFGTLNYQLCTTIDLPAPSENDVAGEYWSPAQWPGYGPQRACYTLEGPDFFHRSSQHL